MKFTTTCRAFGLASAAWALLLSLSVSGYAQIAYPFELPNGIQATLDVDTKIVDAKSAVPVKNMLLGLNCNWPEGLYGKTGYNNPVAQQLIRAFRPTALRFPHGVWANFYDWESDGRRITDDYKTPYDDSVKGHPELKYGFDGFHTLHDELQFDVLFTYNVNYDSPEKSARRMIDRRDKGFDVKWIELGNEIFWKTQRSNAVIDVEKYIAVSKKHAVALRAVDPNVKISVPVHWRNTTSDPWNMAIKQHDYYDAITVHKHMSANEDRDGAIQTLLSRRQMLEMAQEIRTVFPGKPFWISEWSVGCGENAISVLAMADVYLGFFEHPELFEIASYFQINASHALINYDKKSGVHTRTSYGAAYEIIHDVFHDSKLAISHIKSTKIGTGVNSMDAVSAIAVIKDGKIIVLAINKTTNNVPLKLNFDGTANTSSLVHRALAFPDLSHLRTFEMDEDVLAEVKSQSGQIILPPLSINRIDMTEISR